MRILICTRPSVCSAYAIERFLASCNSVVDNLKCDIFLSTRDRTISNTSRVVVEQYFGEENAWNNSPNWNLVVNKLNRLCEFYNGTVYDCINSDRHGVDVELNYYADNNSVDLCLLFNFSHILSSTLIEKFGDNIYNVHSGPLPEARGVNPIFWAMISQAIDHSVTVHKVSSQIDRGDIFKIAPYKIDTSLSLVENRRRCYLCAVEDLVNLIEYIFRRCSIVLDKQDNSRSVYLRRIDDGSSEKFFELGYKALNIEDLVLYQRWLMS